MWVELLQFLGGRGEVHVLRLTWHELQHFALYFSWGKGAFKHYPDYVTPANAFTMPPSASPLYMPHQTRNVPAHADLLPWVLVPTASLPMTLAAALP